MAASAGGTIAVATLGCDPATYTATAAKNDNTIRHSDKRSDARHNGRRGAADNEERTGAECDPYIGRQRRVRAGQGYFGGGLDAIPGSAVPRYAEHLEVEGDPRSNRSARSALIV